MKKADIGLVGLAVMGENLVMNMESKGFTVAVYNRTTEKVKNFTEGRAKGKNIIGAYSIEELVASLEKPRKIFMMVKAGAAVDQLIEQLLPYLEEGDILISVDGNRITDTESLQTLLYNYEVGDTVNVIIYRGGRQYTADLTLHESKG